MQPREKYMTIAVSLFGLIFLIWKFATKGIPGGLDLMLVILVAVGTLIAIGVLVKDWLENR